MDERLLNEIVQRLVAIETKLESIIKVKDDVEDLKKDVVRLQEQTAQQQKEIDAITDTNKWLSRAVIGAVITATIGIIVTVVKIGAGIP